MIAPRLFLQALHVYPVKGCRGFAPPAWSADDFGFHFDRRWMVTDEGGHFISQRSHPRMALIVPTLLDNALRLDAPGMQSLTVPTAGNAPLSRVIIWHDECLAQSCGIEADEWLSEFLGGPHHLVYMPDSTRRPVDPEYRIADARVSFADAFPFLLATTASLEDLNTRLDQPVPMNRFRPNLVIDGSAAFAEDGWREMRIGTMTFSVVKPCARCAVTTVNQATAETAREPLRTLSRFRLIDGKAMFGQNLIHGAPGRVAVGDPVEIVATA